MLVLVITTKTRRLDTRIRHTKNRGFRLKSSSSIVCDVQCLSALATDTTAVRRIMNPLQSLECTHTYMYIMCVCVYIYVYIYRHTHTHTHILSTRFVCLDTLDTPRQNSFHMWRFRGDWCLGSLLVEIRSLGHQHSKQVVVAEKGRHMDGI